MSAAATAGPPPDRQGPMPGDGPAGGHHASNGVNAGAISGARGKTRVFPHIDDLVTAQPDINALAPIRRLLEKGESCAKQAETNLDFRRPDIALQEYIKASTIIVDLIPRHKDYPELKSDRGELHWLYAGLQKRIRIQHEKFEEIKDLIKMDNARSGVQPTVHLESSKDLSIIVQHNGDLKSEPLAGQSKSAQKQLQGPLDMHPDEGDSGRSIRTGLPSTQPDESQSTRRRPPVHPKPDALHGLAIHSNFPLDTHSVVQEKDLAERFSRLRGAGPHSPVQDARIRTQSIGMPGAVDLTTKRDPIPLPSTVPKNTNPRPDRPLGPRDMPKAPTAPPKSQKVPLNVEIPSMPKPPEAIYSPTRNLDNPANLDMLRSGSRNMFSSPGKPPQVAPTSRTLRSTTAATNGRSDNIARPQSLVPRTGPNQFLDHQLPDASTVTAEDLFEYLQRGSDALTVLVVDIRDREDFNEGHIMFHSIICIEPIILRHGVSAEELGQSLVLSPEAEQYLFDMRDTFDLVVYYDQSSTSSERNVSSSSRGDTILGDFSKAVYDYGYEKRLKRPPRLLVGGLDAWVDLMGPRALETVQISDATSISADKSYTKSLSGAPKSRQANVITARRATHGVRILSNEEQNKWKATLSEEVAAISPNEVSFIRTTEDFLRKYPEPSAIQESMVSPSPISSLQSSHSQSQNLINADNTISHQNKPSLMPQIPARPAPALPRQSYSGVSERTKYSSTSLASASSFEYKGTSTISGYSTTRCGLVNTGNTCYLNSVLQALKGTRLLYEAIMTLNTEANPLPIKKGETERPEQLMIIALKAVFVTLSSGQEKRYNPIKFKEYCRKIHLGGQSPTDKFGGKNQQDASEFLCWLLEQLQTDLNYSRARGPLLPLTAAQEAVRREQPIISSSWMQWQRFCHANASIITRAFFGQYATSITCPHCGFVQKSWEPWGQITVPIPGRPGGDVKLMDLLNNMFNESHKLEDYRCDQCKQKGPESLQKISRCPEILIIILGRNEWDGQVHTKNTTRVRFPLDGLSLDSYFISINGQGSEQLDDSFLAPFTFDCYAVIQHFGPNARDGHYTALVKETDPRNGKDVWINYNDSVVKEVEDIRSKSQSENSYVLFYQRRKHAR